MKLVIHLLSGMNITTTLVVLQCQLAQELHGQLSTCIYCVFRFIVAIYVRHECYMDEWEWDSDSEERDGEDYLEEQDQEEELDPFCEAGQHDHLGQTLFSQLNSKIIS